MTLITERPVQLATCRQAYDRIQRVFELSNANNKVSSPDGMLTIEKQEGFFSITARATFPQPSVTVTLRADSIRGSLPTKDLNQTDALSFLSEFVARWEQSHNRTVELDPNFSISSQQELRFRTRIENGDPPIDSPKGAWIALNDLLRGPKKLSSGGGISGDNGRGVTVLYAEGDSQDIIVINRIKTGGAYSSEIRDQSVRVTNDNHLSFTDPQTGKKEGEQALYELNRMIKLLLENSTK